MNLANTDCVDQNDICKKESHDNINHGIFCVTENDLDCNDVEALV